MTVSRQQGTQVFIFIHQHDFDICEAVMQVWKHKQRLAFHGSVIVFMRLLKRQPSFGSLRTGRCVSGLKVCSCGSFTGFTSGYPFQHQGRMKRVSVNQRLSSKHDFECCSRRSSRLLRPICEACLQIK